MNYPLAGSMKDFFIDKSLTDEDFECMINRCYTNYMQQTNDVLFNMLDSHDTQRLRSIVSGIDEYDALLTLLFTMRAACASTMEPRLPWKVDMTLTADVVCHGMRRAGRLCITDLLYERAD